MEKIFKFGALAMFLGTAGVAHADLATTTGGITIKTDDGRFEAKVGGRIHLDTNLPIDDDADNVGEGLLPDQRFDAFFRRARLSLEGKAYGWTYKFENDFAGQNATEGSGFREMWIGTKLGEVANVRFGQAKPYRSMEELTSSNEIMFMERPFSSASGIYRQFQTGVFLDGAGSNFGWGVSAYNLRNGASNTAETDGFGTSVRLYFAPVATDTSVVHLGVSGGIDNPSNNVSGTAGSPLNTVSVASLRYAGRSGPQQSLGAATTDEQTTYAIELAGKAGPIYGQAEYAIATFAEDTDDEEVNTYYVQLSYLITGESKPYDIKKGVFKSPKPKNASGAWEAKVRYDFADAKEVATEREVTQIALGLNWFVNPNVRVMFEYLMGEQEPDGADSQKLDVFATRLQFAF